MSRRAALFDLDRTLVRVNTGSLYLRWQRERGLVRRRQLVRGMWWMARYAFGNLDADAIASRAARNLRGTDEAQFRLEMKDWVHVAVAHHVSEAARREVTRREREGYLCAIVTGSTVYSAEPLAALLGIEHVLASQLCVENGALTGDMVRPLCFGVGKVTLAEAWAGAHDVDLAASVFYSDSISDMPLFERVGERFAVNPDPRLTWTARRRGWPILRWA